MAGNYIIGRLLMTVKLNKALNQDNGIRTNRKASYVPAVTTEVHVVDGNNGNCLRYPSISDCPVTVWVKPIRVTDRQSPKGLI